MMIFINVFAENMMYILFLFYFHNNEKLVHDRLTTIKNNAVLRVMQNIKNLI